MGPLCTSSHQGMFSFAYRKILLTPMTPNQIFCIVVSVFPLLILTNCRDYAASGSLVESIANDAKIKKREYGDLLYSLYLDDPLTTGGRTLRFACGILVDRKGKDIMKALLGMNDEIRKLQTPDDEDIPAFNLWKRITYESISLPSLDAAVVQFPYTNGIVSALVLSYRVRKGRVSTD